MRRCPAMSEETRTRSNFDIAFASLVVSANSNGEDFGTYPVTVLTGGAVISGLLVSGLQYGKWIAGMDPFYKLIEDTYAEAVDGELTDEAVDSVSYFHLAEAVIHQGAGHIEIGYWRGLVGSVTGWTLGRLTKKENDPT